MKHIIDLESFERKDSVLFFRSFPDPHISITSEVECTGGKQQAKEWGISFFLYYTHAMLKAANEIKEFRYRFNRKGEILYYDQLDALAIIRTGEQGKYNTLRLPYVEDLKEFAQQAASIIDSHNSISNPFGAEDDSSEEDQGVILISAIPTLSFTGISFANQSPLGGYPVTLIGKLIVREGKEYIPIGLKVNHAFIDGYHLDAYYNRVSELLCK